MRGASDGRTIILVPEVKANAVIGMTLLWVRFTRDLERYRYLLLLAAGLLLVAPLFFTPLPGQGGSGGDSALRCEPRADRGAGGVLDK